MTILLCNMQCRSYCIFLLLTGQKIMMASGCTEGVQVGYKGNFFTRRVMMHWHRVTRGVVELLSLEVLKKRINVTLSDMI